MGEGGHYACKVALPSKKLVPFPGTLPALTSSMYILQHLSPFLLPFYSSKNHLTQWRTQSMQDTNVNARKNTTSTKDTYNLKNKHTCT